MDLSSEMIFIHCSMYRELLYCTKVLSIPIVIRLYLSQSYQHFFPVLCKNLQYWVEAKIDWQKIAVQSMQVTLT